MVWQGGDKQITAGQILERKFAPNAHCSKPGHIFPEAYSSTYIPRPPILRAGHSQPKNFMEITMILVFLICFLQELIYMAYLL